MLSGDICGMNCGESAYFMLPFLQTSCVHVCTAGSVYRDEFDLAILKMQEDNRLEILKRKWWDGGKCPKEEDHRAKGLSSLIPVSPPIFT